MKDFGDSDNVFGEVGVYNDKSGINIESILDTQNIGDSISFKDKLINNDISINNKINNKKQINFYVFNNLIANSYKINYSKIKDWIRKDKKIKNNQKNFISNNKENRTYNKNNLNKKEEIIKPEGDFNYLIPIDDKKNGNMGKFFNDKEDSGDKNEESTEQPDEVGEISEVSPNMNYIEKEELKDNTDSIDTNDQNIVNPDEVNENAGASPSISENNKNDNVDKQVQNQPSHIILKKFSLPHSKLNAKTKQLLLFSIYQKKMTESKSNSNDIKENEDVILINKEFFEKYYYN